MKGQPIEVMDVCHLSAEVEHTMSGAPIHQARNKVGGKLPPRETARLADTRFDRQESSMRQNILRQGQDCSSCPCWLACPLVRESKNLSRRPLTLRKK